MKKLTLTLLVSFILHFGFAQISNLGFNYQGVYRDNNGVVQKNKSVSVNFIIYHGSVSGSNIAYSENQNTTTDNFGVFNLVIGNGTPTGSTKFNSIDWSDSNGQYYLKVQLVVNVTPIDIATSQLMAVPYAKTSGTTAIINSQNAKTGNILVYDSAKGQFNPTSSVPYANVSGTTNMINAKNANNRSYLVFDSASGQYITLTTIPYANISGSTNIINTKNIHNGDLLQYDSSIKQFIPYKLILGSNSLIDTTNLQDGDLLRYSKSSQSFIKYQNPWSDYAIYEERKPYGKNGGANTTGWQTRQLNTIVDSEGYDIIFDSANAQFSLAPGKYYVNGYITTAGISMRVTSMVFNLSDNTPALLGLSCQTSDASSATYSFSNLPFQGVITVSGTKSKKFNLEMYSDTVSSYVGLGTSDAATSYTGSSSYKPEIYSHIFIQKIK